MTSTPSPGETPRTIEQSLRIIAKSAFYDAAARDLCLIAADALAAANEQLAAERANHAACTRLRVQIEDAREQDITRAEQAEARLKIAEETLEQIISDPNIYGDEAQVLARQACAAIRGGTPDA